LRNELLGETIESVEIEWKTLGNVAELSRGRVMSKEYLAENAGIYPVYSSQTANNGQIGMITSFDFDGEFITWTTDGANAGTVFHRQENFLLLMYVG
jgi:type I restriction enzyme S subunit